MKPLCALLLLFCVSSGMAQTTPAPTAQPVPETNMGPQFAFWIGGALNKYATDEPNKNVTMGFSAQLKGRLLSYNSLDLFSHFAEIRPGLAFDLYDDAYLHVFLLAQAGLSINAQAANNGLSVGNFGYGTGVAYDFGGIFKKLRGRQIGAGFVARMDSSSSNTSANGTVQAGVTKPDFELIFIKGLGKAKP